MARKKADPTPQEEAEKAVTFPGDSLESENAEPEMSLFPSDPESPFPSDGTFYMPSEAVDASMHNETNAEPGAAGAGGADMEADTAAKGEATSEDGASHAVEAEGEPGEGFTVEAAEGYGELLTELSEAAAESEAPPEAAPLLLAAGEEKSAPTDSGDSGEELSDADRMLLEEDGAAPQSADTPAPAPVFPRFSGQRRNDRILTINARDEVETEAEREATLWHEIQNSYRTRHILTGTLDTVERTDSGLTLAVVNYNGFRVAIPAKEMLLNSMRQPNVGGQAYAERMTLMARQLYARLGSEIDFIVKGIENKSRSIVASRRDAMYRKRQTFYFDTDASGQPMIYEGRIVQARVVSVAERVIRVEVFGVECSIRGSGISREWYGSANENFSVGDTILVRVLTIQRPDVENIQITADIRSVSNTDNANLSKCVVQGHYVGRITDVRSGVFFIRLNNGVNAVAHASYDLRNPGKKDDVSFVVTRLDAEHNVALGVITRIIRQNL